MALLSGARNVLNTDLSTQTVARMKKLFPELTDSLAAASILLANTYGSLGDTEKASNIWLDLKHSSLPRKVGVSWTFVNEALFVSRSLICDIAEQNGMVRFRVFVAIPSARSISSSTIGNLC